MSGQSGVLINIAEMIDLAIGTPEMGVVDFCMLQTVLHCLAQQLGVRDKNVELRGSIANLPVGRQPEDSLTIAVDEYLLETDGKPPASPEEQDTMLIVQRIKKGDATGAVDGTTSGKQSHVAGRGKTGETSSKPASGMPGGPPSAQSRGTPGGQPGGTSGGPPSGTLSGSPGGTTAAVGKSPRETTGEDTMVSAGEVPGGTKYDEAPTKVADTVTSANIGRPGAGAPRLVSSSEKLSLVTISKFNLLESTVEDLKNRVYGSIPKNEEILQEVRSQTNIKAITDMWTSLNVSSRLEAAEEGIGKLSSLVQDLIRDTPSAKRISERTVGVVKEQETDTDHRSEEVHHRSDTGSSPTKTVSDPKQSMIPPAGVKTPSENIMLDQSGGTHDADTIASQADLRNIIRFLENLRKDHNNLSNAFYTAMKDLNVEVAKPPSSMPSEGLNVFPIFAEQTSTRPTDTSQGIDPATAQTIATLSNKLDNLEEKLRQCYDTVFAPSGTMQDQINSLQDQMEYYSRYAATGPTDSTNLSPDLTNDLQGLMQLFQTVQHMQVQLQQVHDTALQLAAEREDRQHNINSLLEQIEVLKSIKLDREDMIEALADKADLRMLTRKVSHDQFEMACDDLSRGLEHALGKLNVQESLWQQALDDIQREIETKLDKMELSPVKDFFNSKLKQLQENLKQMAALRREAEAAGTKRKLLTDVNCISCDAKAVMSTEPSAPIGSYRPMPPSMSMKPYLSYELDAIRKTQASGLPQRNMHDWERIDKQMTEPRQPQKVRSETDKHLCNRYCGGSHTTTTPAQRVARLGHFIKQWGPEVLPLSSGFATGDDGRLYKISTVEGANVGPGGAVDGVPCTPKSAKKTEPKYHKPIIVVPEDCPCFDK